MGRRLTLLIIALSTGLAPALASAQTATKAGYYSGRLSCADTLGRYKEVIKVSIGKDGALQDEINFEDSWQLVGASETHNSYSGDSSFDLSFRGDDETTYNLGQQSILLSKDGTMSIARSVKNPVLGNYEGTCSGRLTRATSRENVSLSGDYGRYESSCVTLKKRTPVWYSFSDSGGYYARFKLTASSCSGRGGLTLENYAKYTESATLTRVKVVPPGRWRFSVTTTDTFYVESVPGYK